MELPWGSGDEQDRIEQLESRIEGLEEENQRLEQMLEAEKQRRSKLSTQKQEAEEELNRAKDRIRQLEAETATEESPEKSASSRRLEFETGFLALKKLASMESPEGDLVTVRSPGSLSELEDQQGLKNTVIGELYSALERSGPLVAVVDGEAVELAVGMRPVFEPGWSLSGEAELEGVLERVAEQKHWAAVSAGETRILRESCGEFEVVEHVKSRVDRKHSQGGYSQGRFERKREEQIENHLDRVEELLPDGALLMGEKGLCDRLPGRHVGGFDRNRSLKHELYKFAAVGLPR